MTQPPAPPGAKPAVLDLPPRARGQPVMLNRPLNARRPSRGAFYIRGMHNLGRVGFPELRGHFCISASLEEREPAAPNPVGAQRPTLARRSLQTRARLLRFRSNYVLFCDSASV